MAYKRYRTYREAREKPDSDADFNRRVDACSHCTMGSNYAELCPMHAKEAGWSSPWAGLTEAQVFRALDAMNRV